MKRIVITAIIVCLIIGAGCGYGIGYMIYQPIMKSSANQVSGLTLKVSKLQETISTLQQTISTQETTIASQQAQLSALEAEMSSLQADFSTSESEAEYWKEQGTVLKSRLSAERQRLDTILGITVTQVYVWLYGRQTWEWTLSTPISVYAEYLDRDRMGAPIAHVNMAKDQADDLYIDQMVQKINDAAVQKKLTFVQKVNFVAAFVQSLPYTADTVVLPADDYPLYPLETLFKRGGDCEDTSILVAALLDALGYDAALLYLWDAQHMAVGVSLGSYTGTYYEHEGKKYFYLETTGDGWQLSQLPPEITDTRVSIYPLK